MEQKRDLGTGDNRQEQADALPEQQGRDEAAANVLAAGRCISEAEAERQGLSAVPPEVEGLFPTEFPLWIDGEIVDRLFKAALGRATFAVTPAGLADSYFNWLAHLSLSPGKQMDLTREAVRTVGRASQFAASVARNPQTEGCIEPLPNDHRFDGEEWNRWPFNLISQAFLLTQHWWQCATNNVDGVRKSDERVVSFVTRQFLDRLSPTNFVWTNPKVAEKTIEERGANLLRGFQNLLVDIDRQVSGERPVGAEAFKVGENLAATKGKVVYRNRLIELIQYSPKTGTVRPEPIMIVPAWIMKYYILDLSPHNSLVKYLVEQGYTVFMISWRNPTAEDRDLGLADYHRLGVMDALQAVSAIVPGQKVHAVGYCIGGTLLSASAAAMARDGDDRLKTITLFATQTDFTEAGELMLFISESEVSFLENIMWAQGYLDSRQMAGAFQLLRSNDLIWSRYISEYLMGRRQDMFDLMAWNADATRMPYRMHSEYLRKIYLGNELSQGKLEVGDRPVSISNIDAPIFCVSTVSDHVAPWRSVYKIRLLADTDITFLLTNGGHNAGIVSEPGHEGRSFRIDTIQEKSHYVGPETWRENAEEREGSWWPAWIDWLGERSGAPVPPPSMGARKKGYAPIADAPGTYVHQR